MRIIDHETTASNIKWLLIQNNLAPKDVQEALHLNSVQAVYKWMNPKIKAIPSLDNLLQLADMFGCKVEDILITKNIDVDTEK